MPKQSAARAEMVKAMLAARARLVKAPTGFEHLTDEELTKMTADLNAVASRLEAWEPTE